jgi:hypothetical protein
LTKNIQNKTPLEESRDPFKLWNTRIHHTRRSILRIFSHVKYILDEMSNAHKY